MIDTECEVFFFLVMTFLLIYVIFMGVVCLIEYLLYQKEYRQFKEKNKNKR